jgi:uncharacterized membrane protein
LYRLSNGIQRQFSARIRGFLADLDPDLRFISGFAIAALVLAYIPYVKGTIVAYAFSFAMVTFVPGYAFTLAMFPGKAGMDRAGRALVSFALSLLAAFLSVLMLNMASKANDMGLLMAILAMPAIVFTLIANRGRKNIPPEVRFSIDVDSVVRRARAQLFPSNGKSLNMGLVAVLIIVLTLSIGVMAYIVVAPPPDDGYTEFYLLGPDGTADNYPVKYSLGDSRPVIVGVVNNEGRDMAYDLVITLNDNGMKTIFSEKFTVADKKTWENTVSLVPDRAGDRMDMEFLLYANDNMTAPCSRLHLWVNVTDTGAPEA